MFKRRGSGAISDSTGIMDDPGGSKKPEGREDGEKKQPKVEKVFFSSRERARAKEKKTTLLFAGHYGMSKGDEDFTAFFPWATSR